MNERTSIPTMKNVLSNSAPGDHDFDRKPISERVNSGLPLNIDRSGHDAKRVGVRGE
jgi:hypothetical protein